MGEKELAALKRLGRGCISLLISAVVAYSMEQPGFLLLAPVLNGLAKWLRAKFGLKNIPI